MTRLVVDLESGATDMTPKGSIEFQNQDKISEMFPEDLEVILVQVQGGADKDSEENLITKAKFEQMIKIDTAVKSFTASNGKKYQDFCKKNNDNNECLQDQVSSLSYFTKGSTYDFTASSDADLLDILNNGRNVHFPVLSVNTLSQFKKTTPERILNQDDGTFNLEQAVAGQMFFFLESKQAKDPVARAWEVDLRDHIKNLNQSNEINVGYISGNIFDQTLQSSVIKDMFQLVQSIILLICYSFMVMGYCSRVHSRVSVVLQGLLTIGVSVVECLMLGVLISGQSLNDMHKLIGFLLIGIGYDDVYVLMNGFDRALLSSEEPDEQVAQTQSTNGVSITVSSLTSFISFSIGNFSSLQMIRTFSFFAGLGVLCLWINQFLIFGPLLCIHAHRVSENLSDPCTPCLPDNDPKQDTDNIKTVESKKLSVNITDNTIPEYNDEFIMDLGKAESTPNQLLNRVFNFQYHVCIKPGISKFIVVCLVIFTIFAAQQGIPKVSSKNTVDMYIPSDSQVFLDVERDLNMGNSSVTCSFQTQESDIDYSSFMVQQQFINLADKTKSWEYFWGNQFSWYDELNQWVTEGNCDDSGSPVTMTNGLIPPDKFYMCLGQFLPLNTQVASALTLNEDYTIKQSKINFKFNNPSEAKDAVPIMDSVYEVAKFGPRNTIAQQFQFVNMWSLERVLQDELFQFLLSAGASIMVVIHLIFNNLLGTLIVTAMIVNILLIVFMSIYYCGLQLNIVTLIFLIMSLGISVDYSAHIMHEFLEAVGTREQRVEQALTKMGPAIVHAALSTFLGVCFTILGAGFVWRAFFSIWSAVVGAGFLQSCMVLPVLLTLIGPENNESNELDDWQSKALAEENITDDERKQIAQVYGKFQAIKSVLSEYVALKNMESSNDLKNWLKRKNELLKKIWKLNQLYNISIMSKQLEDATTVSFNKVEMRSNGQDAESNNSKEEGKIEMTTVDVNRINMTNTNDNVQNLEDTVTMVNISKVK